MTAPVVRPSRYQTAVASLNEEQQRAVDSRAQHLRIVAGPGTGKTQTMTLRIANHLRERGASPREIVAFTFTRKAANELRSRVGMYASRRDAGLLTIGTFHAVALRLLRQWWHTAGFRHGEVSVLDEDDQLELLRAIADRYAHGADAKKLATAAALRLNAAPGFVTDSPKVDLLLAEYAAHMECYNAVDYDGIITRAIALLQNDEARAVVQSHWKHIFVDEFQDVDDRQMQFVALLAGDTGSVSVVGDVDQSIYGWRGANVNHTLKFADRWPGAETVILTDNYRSARPILVSASNLIRHNAARIAAPELRAMSGADGDVQIVSAKSREAQCDIALSAVISQRKAAILARTNYQLTDMAATLAAAGVMHRLYTPYNEWRSRIVRASINLARVVCNHYDDYSLLRLLEFLNVGTLQTRAEMVYKAAKDGASVYDTFIHGGYDADIAAYISSILPETPAGSFLGLLTFLSARQNDDASADLLAAWVSALRISPIGYADGSVARLLSLVSTRRVEDDVRDDDDPNTVLLMTAHAAKGLEFETVVLLDCNEGSFPMTRSDSEIEEERRVFYVAMTRARRNLLLIVPASKEIRGVTKLLQPSRFVGEIAE